MANSITASVVVQFANSGADGIFTAEVDDRDATEGGLNGGRTSFLPGDTVYILLFQSSNVTLEHYEASLGVLAPVVGTVSVTKTEDITFAGETEASLRYPTSAIDSYSWIGRNLGTISLVGDSTLRVPAPAPGDYAVGVARVTYTTIGKVFRLSHSAVAFTDYPIVAFFAGVAA